MKASRRPQRAVAINPHVRLKQQCLALCWRIRVGELLLSPNMEFVVIKPLHRPTESPLKELCEVCGCQVIEMTEIAKEVDLRS